MARSGCVTLAGASGGDIFEQKMNPGRDDPAGGRRG